MLSLCPITPETQSSLKALEDNQPEVLKLLKEKISKQWFHDPLVQNLLMVEISAFANHLKAQGLKWVVTYLNANYRHAGRPWQVKARIKDNVEDVGIPRIEDLVCQQRIMDVDFTFTVVPYEGAKEIKVSQLCYAVKVSDLGTTLICSLRAKYAILIRNIQKQLPS